MEGQSPSFELPKPQPPEHQEAIVESSKEHFTQSPEAKGHPAPMQHQPLAITTQSTPIPSPLLHDDNIAIATPPTTVGIQAHGNAELIDKVWVEKAKQVIKQTKNDPYKQNKQLSHVKAEYLKVEFNKDIKAED